MTKFEDLEGEEELFFYRNVDDYGKYIFVSKNPLLKNEYIFAFEHKRIIQYRSVNISEEIYFFCNLDSFIDFIKKDRLKKVDEILEADKKLYLSIMEKRDD